MKQNYSKYIEIKEQTYNIFEIYHHRALVNLFKSNVSAKDLSLIKSIATLKEATPNKITSVTGISATNLSNRLALLEAENLIERTKNIKDQRQSIVTLTAGAHAIIAKYQTYINNFLTYTRKNLSLNEKLAFNHFLGNWRKAKNGKSSDKEKTAVNALDEIEAFFLNREIDFFSDQTISFAFSDLFYLSELYLNEEIVHLSLPKLADYLFIPYQTINSKINRFISEGHITKNKKKLTFSHELIHAIDQFIILRIINYYDAFHGATTKEYEVVLKVFAFLKSYASTFF